MIQSGIFGVVFSSGSILTLCITVLMVTAITLIFKTQTTTNFAQTTIATFGAYVVAKLNYTAKINVILALLIGLVVCICLGLMIDIFVIRRGRNVNAVGKQIITMGFTYILLAVILLALRIRENGVDVQLNPPTVFIDTTKVLTIGETSIPYNTLVCLGITIVVEAILFLCIYKTKWGLGVRMTASNETVAQMVGVNTHIITAISWAVAAALGCLGATFANNAQGVLSTTMMSTIQLSAFLACIVGGFSTFWGSIVAAGILWLLNNVVGIVGISVPKALPWREVIVYVIAMIIVLFKPNGLFGKVAAKKV